MSRSCACVPKYAALTLLELGRRSDEWLRRTVRWRTNRETRRIDVCNPPMQFPKNDHPRLVFCSSSLGPPRWTSLTGDDSFHDESSAEADPRWSVTLSVNDFARYRTSDTASPHLRDLREEPLPARPSSLLSSRSVMSSSTSTSHDAFDLQFPGPGRHECLSTPGSRRVRVQHECFLLGRRPPRRSSVWFDQRRLQVSAARHDPRAMPADPDP
jgi:hypothetical protein